MDGLNALSKVSGLSTDVIKEIAVKVVQNNKILNSCNLHNFDIPCDKRKWQCSNCGGTVDSIHKNWYEKGIAHTIKIGNKMGE